jgi:cell division protease FtsH
MAATDIARSMVKEYGMSQQLGQVNLAHNKQSQFLNPNSDSGGGDYSAMTTHLIDKEIRRIIDDQCERVLESEVIEDDQLKAFSEAVLNRAKLGNGVEKDAHHQALAA